ncbi:MAG: MBL fold metallo-hydrolase [Gemmatimonadetes bacterium]|nr:MBL fold metallo-hydrolase [Gemmatimonadota bacterium]
MKAPLVLTRKVGDIMIHALDGGSQLLDGGAMFGVVPKPLWEKRIAADERNRIPLAMRCLLVETPDELVLIDNGAGNKESGKFTDIYGIDNAASDPARFPTRIEEALHHIGYSTDDVDIMLDTHLHFDHAGGNTRLAGDGGIVLSFPRARYVVQRGELEWSRSRNERIQASYLPHNIEPVSEAGRFDLVDGDVEIVPGIRVLRTPGHTPHHQSVLITSKGETACFLADVMPTSAHLPLPWIMGYDVEPLVTLESKRALLARAREEEWLLVFEHDPVVAWGRLDPAQTRPVLVVDNGN